MTTPRDVYDKAMQMLGYVNKDGSLDRQRDADLNKSALLFVNQIYTDMFFVETPHGEFAALHSMDDDIPLSDRCTNDIMPYGVAMMLAQRAGDATMQSIYSYAYNEKRQAGVKNVRTVKDTLPTGEW